MKIIARRFFCLLIAAVLMPCFTSRVHAKGRDMDVSQPVQEGNSNSLMDAGEEARKIRRLVKLALYPNASPMVKKSLSDEITLVEKSGRLRDNVVKHLLQDDSADPDPTLPRVVRVTYKDGTLRGLLFVQTDAERSAKPGELAWEINSKREKHDR